MEVWKGTGGDIRGHGQGYLRARAEISAAKGGDIRVRNVDWILKIIRHIRFYRLYKLNMSSYLMEYNGVLKKKSKAFALRIIKLCKYVSFEKKEMVMTKQLLRAGTSIGAMQREGEYAESKLDFIHKYAIAQKECNETLYWLELLYESSYLNEDEYNSIYADAEELMKLLTSSIKTAKQSVKSPSLLTNHSSLNTNR